MQASDVDVESTCCQTLECTHKRTIQGGSIQLRTNIILLLLFYVCSVSVHLWIQGCSVQPDAEGTMEVRDRLNVLQKRGRDFLKLTLS